jgi:hypothetical protein
MAFLPALPARSLREIGTVSELTIRCEAPVDEGFRGWVMVCWVAPVA